MEIYFVIFITKRDLPNVNIYAGLTNIIQHIWKRKAQPMLN